MPPHRPLVLVDLNRLLSAARSSAPTGVERVELAYAEHLRQRGDVEAKFVAAARGEVRGIDSRIAHEYLARLAQRWAGRDGSPRADRAWQRILAFLRGEPGPFRAHRKHAGPASKDAAKTVRDTPIGPIVGPPNLVWAREALAPTLQRARADDRPVLYVNVSHSRLHRPELLTRLVRHPSVRSLMFCHDVLPCLYPEYFLPGSDMKHSTRVATFRQMADAVVTNSHTTAQALDTLMGKGPRPPVTVAHLGADWPTALTDARSPADVPDAPYFVMVSTIEPRKNHLLILQIWRRLVETGCGGVPKLIIVGKRGWENDAILAVLDRSASLWPHVCEAGAIPDHALMALLRGARALLMPSFAEGFGIPIIEALAHGVPVIASDIEAFREIGQEIPDLIDPLDGLGWLNAILDYARPDSAARAAQCARLARFEPLTWATHFATVDDLIDRLLGAPPRQKTLSRATRLAMMRRSYKT